MKKIEMAFREEATRKLKLGQIDRSKPQASFFKFYGWFKERHDTNGLKTGEWKQVFLDVLKKTPLFTAEIKNRRGKLRVITNNMIHGAISADYRHRRVLGNDY